MVLVMEMCKKFQEKFEKEYGVKLGFMSFFVKVVVYVFKKFFILNVLVDGNDIVYYGYFDIGIVVGLFCGLVVFIICNVDQFSFVDIEKKIVEFGQKVKDGKIGLDDFFGGIFFIFNGGIFGLMLFIFIINLLQLVILGVYVIKDCVVVENGQIVICLMNYLVMFYDYCIIDGCEVVLGLVVMKEVLEDLVCLLFDI